MSTNAAARVEPQAIQDYLARHVAHDARLVAVAPLGGTSALKAYGYGRPLRITFEIGGRTRDAVLRTMGPDPYGHERRADRVGTLVEGYDDFRESPRHVRSLDVGTLDADGALVPMARGEPWLLTEYAEGTLYASDLAEIASAARASASDRERAQALADYLVALHAEPRPESTYVRALRDVVGSGEGLAGVADGWPKHHEVADAERLCLLEQAAVGWRWRLKKLARRACRTHGDYHPFNVLFRGGADFTVLDSSRGGAGDAADDVTCMTVNYLFFALRARNGFSGACRELWETFWERYLMRTGDTEILKVVPPFFAWRTLVVASPVWYPDVTESVRDRLLIFAERLLAGAPFDPRETERLL